MDIAVSSPKRRPDLRVGFILLDKFTLRAFSGFIDALRLAADDGARSRQIHCAWSIMGRGPVTASCGLVVTPNADLIDPTRFDYIAVCGGNGYLEPGQPAWLTQYLSNADAAGVSLIGVCTGTFNIAQAGLMDGVPACVHWNAFPTFRERFPAVDACPDGLFIDAGSRITCAGSAGADDLALYLIARHCGHARAQLAARHMMLQGIRPPSTPQAHFYSDLEGVRDVGVRRTVHLMEQRLNAPMPAEELARFVGISLRQLERRFHDALGTGPSAFYRRLRLHYGAWLLTHTTASVTEIASDAGFADAAHFSRGFRGAMGISPGAFRRAKRSAGEAIAARVDASLWQQHIS